MRAKVVEQMVAALEKVAGEGGAGPKAGEPASVAAAVEKELFAYYGETLRLLPRLRNPAKFSSVG